MQLSNSEKKNEYILTAAIHYTDGTKHVHQPVNIETGFVLTGMRHHNVIHSYNILTGKRTGPSNSVSGFITSLNRFVDRKEAGLIALAANQVKELRNGGDELYSEDLY